MDETFVGGERHGKRGRGAAGKSLVVIAVELLEPQGIGRIRLLRVASAAAAALTPAALAMVEPGSVVRTDDWNGYVGLASASYRREIIGPDAELVENRLPCCHLVASLHKRWLFDATWAINVRAYGRGLRKHGRGHDRDREHPQAHFRRCLFSRDLVRQAV